MQPKPPAGNWGAHIAQPKSSCAMFCEKFHHAIERPHVVRLRLNLSWKNIVTPKSKHLFASIYTVGGVAPKKGTFMSGLCWRLSRSRSHNGKGLAEVSCRRENGQAHLLREARIFHRKRVRNKTGNWRCRSTGNRASGVCSQYQPLVAEG